MDGLQGGLPIFRYLPIIFAKMPKIACKGMILGVFCRNIKKTGGLGGNLC